VESAVASADPPVTLATKASALEVASAKPPVDVAVAEAEAVAVA